MISLPTAARWSGRRKALKLRQEFSVRLRILGPKFHQLALDRAVKTFLQPKK